MPLFKLFSLLRAGKNPRSGPDWILRLAFGITRRSPPNAELVELESLKQKVDLDLSDLPLLVRFRDPQKPATVETVDPQDLAKSFGQGVQLLKAQIEITQDPVAFGIVKILPWLPYYYNKMLDGERIERLCAQNHIANSLSSGAFKTETK